MRSLIRALVGFGLAVYDRPWPALAVWVVTLLIGASGLLTLPLDASLEGMLGEHAPEVLQAESIAERFGRDPGVVVAFGAPDVLDPAALARLARLTDALRALPGADDVTSVLDAPLVQSTGSRLQVDRALRPFPDTDDELRRRAHALRSCAFCRFGRVSQDGTLALISVSTEDGAPRASATERRAAAERARALIDDVAAVLEQHAAPGIRLGISGKVATVDALYRELTSNLVGFIVGSIAASTLLLWILFRSPAGVLIPGVVMLSPLVLTLGLMGALEVPLQLVSDSLAPLIIVVSMAGTMHVLTALDRERAVGGPNRDALRRTLERKAEALLLSAFTTSGALLTLASAGLEPIADIGVYGAFGTAAGVGSMLVVVPAVLRVWPWEPMTRATGLHVSAFRPVLDHAARLAIQHTRAVLVSSFVVLVVTLAMVSQLRFVHAPLGWLPDVWEVRRGTEWVDEATQSSMVLHLVVDAGAPGAARDTAFLERLAAFQDAIPARLDGGLRIGAVASVVDALEMVQLGLGERASGTGRDLRLLELADPESARRWIDPAGQQVTVQIRAEVAGASHYVDLLAVTRGLARSHLGPGVTVEEGGLIPIFAGTLTALRTSTVRSYALAFGVLLVALVVVLRDLRLAALAMLPNLLPLTLVGAGMWLWSIPLDTFTMLTLSLAIGLVVDDTIHLLVELRRTLPAPGEDPDDACRAALQESGPAMLVTTLVLVAGWAVLLQSDLRSVAMFAWLGTATLVIGLVADLIVAPALMVAWARSTRQA